MKAQTNTLSQTDFNEHLIETAGAIPNLLWTTAENAGEKKDRATKSRLLLFADWQATQNTPWILPNFVEYRHYLEEEDRKLQPASIAAYLNTIKNFYKRLKNKNVIRDLLYEALGDMPFYMK